MEHSDYRRQVAELEHWEAKLWREFTQARNVDLPEANAIHSKHQRIVKQIMNLHCERMAQFVHEDNQRLAGA